MKTGTQKRINFYQKTLPTFKDKLAGAVMMLVVALTCLVVATYAWTTLSTSPEVTGISTTIAANGSLEIALSDTDGEEPDASAVGDSTAAGTDVMEANLTWGNLVNLSSGYGLDELTLRPAVLASQTLLTRGSSPLWGASYGSDGRVTSLNSDYAYTVWQEATDTSEAAFVVPDTTQYGVRAISSVTYTNLSGDLTFSSMCTEAETLLAEAGNLYITLTSDDDNLDALAGMLGVYVQNYLDSSTSVEVNDYLEDFYGMMVEFGEAMDKLGEALATILNLQLFLTEGEDYTAYTLETLVAASSSTLKSQGLYYEAVSTFITDYNQYQKDLATMAAYVESANAGTSIYWSNISSIVNRLCNTSYVEIDGTTVSNLSTSDIVSMVFSSKTHTGVINDSSSSYNYLYDFEEITGYNMYAKGVTISVTYYISVDLTANVYTSLYNSGTSLFYDAYDVIYAMNTGDYVDQDAVAEDTYGLVIDLWVRTNDLSTILTLEGSLTQETDEEGNTTITGAEGENRVWEENALLDSTSTTQGTGSFYIYYADGVEDASTVLETLSHLKIAFLDSNNTILATASLDTSEYYSASGKYYLPIVVDASDGGLTYTDDDGNTKYGITTLTKNTATRITVIVYLDGTTLENDDVLAASEIQGTLNLQFGSSESLTTAGDTTLESATRTVSASVDKTEFDWDEDDDFTTTLTVTVDGDTPATVTAAFQRKISTTQGKRLETITLTQDDDGNWVGDYTFTSPGTYILRSVTIDGTEIDLDETIEVVVEGYQIQSLTVSDSSIFTSASSASTTVTLSYVTSDVDKMPSSVKALFESEDGTYVTATLTYNTTSGTWSGTAKFTTSGNYTLKYVIMDGEYTLVDESMQREIEVVLGLTASVSVVRDGDNEETYVYDSDGNLVYETDDDGNYVYDDDGNLIPLTVETTPSLTFVLEGAETFSVSVIIMDDQGNELTDLTDVELVYLKSGSSLKQNGLYDSLEWDEDSGCYVGTFTLTKAGIYNFSYVSVEGSTVTKATGAPTITAQSPNPPYYIDGSTTFTDASDDYIFAPDGDASVTVQIAYSSSAESVVAVFTREGSSETYTAEGVMGTTSTVDGVDVTTWTFTIPDYEGAQDGVWTLTELDVAGVYDEENTYYDSDTPYVLEVSDSPSVKVVETVVVEYAQDEYVYGVDDDGDVAGYFMDGYSVSFTVYIEDYEGEALNNVSGVSLEIEHSTGTASSYGGYTSDSLGSDSNLTGLEDFSLTLTAGSDGITYTSSSQTLRLAGLYNTSLSFTVGSESFTYTSSSSDNTSPTIEIYSMSPTLTASSISPSGSVTYYNVSAGYSTSSTSSTTGTNSITSKDLDSDGDSDDYYVQLYLTGSRSSYTHYTMKNIFSYSSATYYFYTFTAPTLTLELADMGSNFTKATLTVTDSGSNDRSFAYTSDNSSKTVSVGGTSTSTFTVYTSKASALISYGTSVTYASAKYTVNGTYSSMTVTYGGISYTVNLDNVIQIYMPETAY